MVQALQGFATIGAIIALAVLLTHVGFFGRRDQELLIRLCFFVAGPALMVTVMARTDTSEVFSTVLAATVLGVAVPSVIYVVTARLLWRRGLGDTVIGTLCSAYVNAGNLGLPVATYILGDPAYIAPVLLLQLGILQPVAMLLLDLDAPDGGGLVRVLTRIVSNPMTVATLFGLFLGPRLPDPVLQPIAMVGGVAVPGMLLAYGIALRMGFGPGGTAPRAEVGLVVGLKLVVQPLAAFLASVALGLPTPAVFAVTVAAALPTAQNVFTHATRYERGTDLSRVAILLSTVGCVPVILLIAAVLT